MGTTTAYTARRTSEWAVLVGCLVASLAIGAVALALLAHVAAL